MKSMHQIWIVFILTVAVLLPGASPGVAQMGSDHDAAEEQMLTGERGASGRPRSEDPDAAEPEPLEELSYATRLDRTAVWVGDQFHYIIVVDHDPIIEFVLENLSQETVNMDPFRVVDVGWTETQLKNGHTRLFVDMVLSSFLVGEEEAQIPQLTLFYFRRGGATIIADEAAAESLTVEGPIVSLRSSLPPEATDLRDSITVTSWPSGRRFLSGIGWLALGMLVLGAGWESYGVLSKRHGRQGPDPRKMMAEIQDRWSQYVPMDFANRDTLLDFYGRTYQDLKEYLGYVVDAPTEGLTSDDMQEELVSSAAASDVVEKTTRVLKTCEDARYGSNSKGSTEEDGRNLAQDVRDIFQATKG